MPIQWIMLWEGWIASGAKPKKDAFADPLDGAEWRGLGWTVSLIAWVLLRRPAQTVEFCKSRVAPQPALRSF